ncbi:hypothetical protein B5M43_003450 [Microbacterium sp. MEC084]|uniref:hypothetical protein n=1 Tax=Microbacterium sp. MEC084 TaxID=1963027 RepID=UPI00106F9888|nr:hypothetical protein [Microbacterium sp. MEC084]MCD1267905.1 hypothetical protein [Microbacterium sp. MEC084]
MENTNDIPASADGRPLGFWLRAVDGLIGRGFEAAFAGERVDRRDWMILNALAGDIDPALAERIRGRVSRRPKRLVRLAERGWVAAVDGEWTLTDEGRAAKARLAEKVDGVRARVSGVVPDEDYATTLRTLEAIARELGGDDAAVLRFGARGHRRRGFAHRAHRGDHGRGSRGHRTHHHGFDVDHGHGHHGHHGHHAFGGHRAC